MQPLCLKKTCNICNVCNVFFCNFTPENIVSTTNIMQRNSYKSLSHRVLPSYPCHPACNMR